MSHNTVKQPGEALFPTYARYPITLVKGQGSWVWDDEHNKYLDFVSGIAVTNLGHAPQVIKEALVQQLDELWHVSNLYHIPNQQQAAQRLVDHSCADKVFFCNSGAEANEAAIKLARRYQQKIRQQDRYEIITFQQSFHGRTLATLTATGQEKVKDGFLPLPAGFRHVTLHDVEGFKAAINEHTAAVLMELVLAEGGVLPVEQSFVDEVVALCKEHGILLIIDEIQTGMGRTGRLFAHELYGVEPDIFTLAKGLGSGFPVGAMLAKEYLAEAFSAGTHGSTFGGTPIATAVVNATLQTIVEQQLPERAAQMGQYLTEQLVAQLGANPLVVTVRGRGLLIGIELTVAAGDYIRAAQLKGLLTVPAGPNVIRLLPNLLVTKEEIDFAVQILADVLNEVKEVG